MGGWGRGLGEGWMEVSDILQETGIKTISMEKKCKKAKWLPEEALQIAVKRRKVKSKGEKELQARILGWVAFPFSRGSSQPRDRTQVSRIARGFFTS